jgi:hypothetical protein
MVIKDGTPDSFGVMRSDSEIQLNSYGLIFAAIILGWALNYLTFLDGEARLQDPFFISWLTTDCIILMLRLFYSYFQKYFTKNGEIVKNIYTMKVVQ